MTADTIIALVFLGLCIALLTMVFIFFALYMVDALKDLRKAMKMTYAENLELLKDDLLHTDLIEQPENYQQMKVEALVKISMAIEILKNLGL